MCVINCVTVEEAITGVRYDNDYSRVAIVCVTSELLVVLGF